MGKIIAEKKKILFKLMFSFMSILAFLLVAWIVAQNIAVKTIQGEINKLNMAMLKQVQLIMDSQIRNVEKTRRAIKIGIIKELFLRHYALKS